MIRFVSLLAVLAISQAAAGAAGLPEDDYRGGWETFGQQSAHILEFSILGSQVRGIDCTSCSDATTLAFVDGHLTPTALHFTITHVNDDGSTAYQDEATATFNHGQLVVDGTSGLAGTGHFHYVMRKDPRGPAPLPGGPVGRLPAGAVVAPVHIPPSAPAVIPPGLWAHRICQYLEPRTCPYESPTAPERLSANRIVGVWVGLRDGPGKQFFIIRRVGQTLRGMACGPCDNPYTMATLGDFQIDGDTLRFNILHEDWGRPGFIPFHNQITAHVADNEMRIVNVPDRGPQPSGAANSGAAPVAARAAAGGNTLFGPISIEATRGNHTP